MYIFLIQLYKFMNAVLEMSELETNELTESAKLTQAQLNAVKDRAIALWGDRWLIQLCYKYAEVLGLEKRSKTSLVQRWFNQNHAPNLENFNTLLLAVGCKISISCTEVKQIL
jgi:hypothetical protein